MLKDLENYARMLEITAAVAKTATLALVSVDEDVAPYLKAETSNVDEGGAGEWIKATLDVVTPLSIRAEFYTTLLYDAGGDPEEARKALEHRRNTIKTPEPWIAAARRKGVPEGNLERSAEAGRRIMDFETTLALALLNKPENPVGAKKSDDPKK